MSNMKPVLKPNSLYLGDNGRCCCGEHSGTTALYTGCDISGQPVMELTPDIMREWVRDIDSRYLPVCEQPGCGKRPSALWSAQS